MAVFTSSVLTMRRKMIIQALRTAGAFGPETAKKLSETDLVNPDSYPEYTKQLVDRNEIHMTPDGRYYTEKSDAKA